MLVAAMRHASAQQSDTMKRIALVNPSTKVADMRKEGDPGYRAFADELERLGYVEGKNITFERYSGEGHPERYDDLVRQVVSTTPDAIYSVGTPLTRRFKAATSTIPIVAFTVSAVTRPL